LYGDPSPKLVDRNCTDSPKVGPIILGIQSRKLLNASQLKRSWIDGGGIVDLS